MLQHYTCLIHHVVFSYERPRTLAWKRVASSVVGIPEWRHSQRGWLLSPCQPFHHPSRVPSFESEVENLRYPGKCRQAFQLAGAPAFPVRPVGLLCDWKVAPTRRQECLRYRIICQLRNSG
jgi:hypothetical protein